MAPPSLKLLITGEPGVGKTTALRKVVESLRGRLQLRGFLTEEIRERGRRTGFQGVTLDGQRFVLARHGLESPFQVGPYGVDVASLEAVGVPALVPGPDTDLVVLDEIGKMEAFSTSFREQVERLLAGPVPLLASVALHGTGFLRRIRRDPRVSLVRMSRASRNALPAEMIRRLRQAGVGGPTSPAAGAGTGPTRR